MTDSARPLDGLTIVVTRAEAQASVLNEKLLARGAIPVGVATIEIVPPADGGAALRAALAAPEHYAQIVVTSPNGASALAAAVEAIDDLDPTHLPPVACVGPSTAARLVSSPLRVNVVPDRAVAEGLLEAVGPPRAIGAGLLLVQAEVARVVLERGLAAKGWYVNRVTAYRTIDAVVSDEARAQAADADVIVFTSSSTVERFLRLVGAAAVPPVVASIGPITSATARELGLRVDIEADPHTIDGLIDALVSWATPRG